MTDKRKLKRVPLSRCLNVYDAMDNELIGQVLDIHTEGMLVMNRSYLAPKCRYRIKVEIPKDLHMQDITLEAVSVWTVREFDPGCYNTGFRFSNATAESTRAIQALIQNYGRHIVRYRELTGGALHDN